MTDSGVDVKQMLWKDLPAGVREALTGKLAGLWQHPTDEDFFNWCPVDKQQTLLIMASRLMAKGLWHPVEKITDVWGVHGVGIKFIPAAGVLGMLRSRKDFTRFMARHKGTTGGFYEKGRGDAVLHFIYTDGDPQEWGIHFDLYSPLHSLPSIFKHLRYEFLGHLFPDWQMIKDRLDD
jgi:hypothetical protein